MGGLKRYYFGVIASKKLVLCEQMCRILD